MKQVVLVTGHYLQSDRRAGFHWLADAYHRAGWRVLFFTAAISRLSRLRGDYRFAYPVRQEARRVKWIDDRLASYVWYTPWHPANLRSMLLNRLARGLFSRYGDLPLGPAEPLVKAANLIIFESTPGLMLFDRFKRLNPDARYAYRVSDDLHVLRNHPVVLAAEDSCTPKFDLISVPSEFLLRRFGRLPHAAVHHHGACREILDRDVPSPYGGTWRANAVFTGSAFFDRDFLRRASRLFGEWAFHIVGRVPRLPRRENVFAHGEMPFARLAAFLKHADIGLQTLEYREGAESFTDSVKVIQYTYCRLPVVAPGFLRSPRTNVFYYNPGGDESIRQAMEAARHFDRTTIDPAGCGSWDDLAAKLAGPRGISGLLFPIS